MDQEFIIPVHVSTKSANYPSPRFAHPEQLTDVLKESGIKIVLGNILKGGTVSQVYESEFENEKVVVKHSETLIPFDPTELSISQNGQNTDNEVLSLLQKSSIRVPELVKVLPGIYTTIMEDLRPSGFQLLNSLILKGELPQNSAEKIGESLAKLAQESRNWKKFETNESPNESIYERGLELRLAYPNSQKQYLELEKIHTENNEHWTWPDGHPKNIFVNADGNTAFIDFGRSYWGDQRFMLPNFLAHIAIYGITGYLKANDSVLYIKNCVQAYKNSEPVDEELLCKYLGMEVLHRANGKWIEGINTSEQKMALYKFGLTIFDLNVNSIESLLDLFKQQSKK